LKPRFRLRFQAGYQPHGTTKFTSGFFFRFFFFSDVILILGKPAETITLQAAPSALIGLNGKINELFIPKTEMVLVVIERVKV
jgi:hypothetical protein